MIFLSRSDVEASLDLDALVDAIAVAMTELSAGEASMPPRNAARIVERDAMLAAMPGYVPGVEALAAKLVAVFPHADPSHQALIAVFDPHTGEPRAVMDGTAITAARTAAGSALATKLLAPPDASVLAILGTGVQAWAHARAVVRVRPIRRVHVGGRDPAKAEALAARIRDELGLEAIAMGTEYAQRDADVVCACTHSPAPVVMHNLLSPLAHVTSVGFSPDGPEVDAATVAHAFVVVESRATAIAPFPAGPHEIESDGQIAAEIGELVAGVVEPPHGSITLYKSAGVAVQDAAAAALVLERARSLGRGTDVLL